MTRILLNESLRQIAEMKKYKFNLIFANLSLLILFYSLSSSFGTENKLANFFMLFSWYFASHGLYIPAYIVEEELIDRSIVNIFMSRTSLFKVLIFRSIVQVITDLVKAVPLFGVLAILLKIDLGLISFSGFLGLTLYICLSIASAYLLGIMISSLSMIFTRTNEFVSILANFTLFFSGTLFAYNSNIAVIILNKIFPFHDLRTYIKQLVGGESLALSASIIWIRFIGLAIISYFFMKFMLSIYIKKEYMWKI